MLSLRYGFGFHPVNVATLLLLALLTFYGSTAKADGGVRILVLGDSLTAGYGLPEPDAFPQKLEDRLRRDGIMAKVINGGVSGDTTAGGLSRITWALAGDLPDFVIVELGANDGLRGLEPASTKANLEAIVRIVQDQNIPVMIAGMLAPPNLGDDYADDFNALFSDVAVDADTAFYPFFLDGVAAVPELNQADGIHPNAAGVDVIVEKMAPHVIRWIRAHHP